MTLATLAGSIGLHVDQNTWATYAGKALAAAALVAGGILCPADILYKGFGISISVAAESRIVWWSIAVGVVSAWVSNQKTDRRNPASAGAQSRTGGGMTVGLMLATGAALCALAVPGCTALRNLKPGPNGYTRPQIVQMLTDASWGLSEGCTQEWVPAPVCGDVQAGLQTAKDTANKSDAATLQGDVVLVLQRIKMRLAPDSRAIPFFDYVIKLLGGQ